ncbi:MAG TPA: hypothetical protein VMT50_07700 [Steroidobacteraceae bacterium]|nr:hypothetical protein [Steroidobacteraceae bacterium]
MRRLEFVLAVVLLTGCAAEPSPPAPPPSAAAPVVHAPAAAPAASASIAAPAAVPAVKAPPGYKLVQRKGETLFCHTKAELGSRIETEECLTPDQYQQQQADTEAARQLLRKNGAQTAGTKGG